MATGTKKLSIKQKDKKNIKENNRIVKDKIKNMSSDISHSYLNTCLKVPVDPCSNCPAPTYNRPKLYLGCLSTTSTATLRNKKHCNALAMEARSSCNDIRPLAKFYDSIPDYRELNHLSGAEFFSTLNTLRTTCRQLKVTTNAINNEDYCSTTASTLPSSTNGFSGSRCKKTKKYKKSKKHCTSQSNHKNNEKQESNTAQEIFKTNNIIKKISTKNLKTDIEKEVEELKKSLQEFETEFRRPLTTPNQNECRSQSDSPLNEAINNKRKDTKKLTEEFNNTKPKKVPVRSTSISESRERLRKSLSYNDLHTITEPTELEEFRKKNKTWERLSFKGFKNIFQDSSKLSHYFQQTAKNETTSIPEIIVNSPENTVKKFGDKKIKKKHNKSKEKEYNMSFPLFDFEPNKKEHILKHSTPSPVHPVARPNLAATLRLESSKKKLKELKNNCTYHDTTPQFDWEVRKTPAWKTLSLNESHKEVLRLRLATRKAEQELQQREYELNMEIMRQRVKSAPLLLEGPTYWGPFVGKQSHPCQKEGRHHTCQPNQRTKRKKNSSRSQSCRHKSISDSTSALDSKTNNSSPRTYRVQIDSAISNKLNTLRKIYGTRSRSRNSIHSTSSQRSPRSSIKRTTVNSKTSGEELIENEDGCHIEIDSGDELSSFDRALL